MYFEIKVTSIEVNQPSKLKLDNYKKTLSYSVGGALQVLSIKNLQCTGRDSKIYHSKQGIIMPNKTDIFELSRKSK